MEMRRDLCPFPPQIIQFGLYELPEPGRLEFLLHPKQKVLLFAAATVRHTDRKQILIIVWTHHKKKEREKNTSRSHPNESEMLNCKHGGPLCPFPLSQECRSSHDSRWGWGGE